MSFSEWKKYTVQELVDQKMLDKPLDGNHGGMHPKTSDYVSSGIPFIMANDLKNGKVDYSCCNFITEKQAKTLKKGFAKPGDVLLTHKATMGRTAIVDNSYPYIVLTPQVTYYRVLKGIDNKYLKYYFDSKDFQDLLLNWSGSGSTRAYLGITAQLKLPVILPPLAEQKAIAATLSALDDMIELNNQINKTLEQMAQAIFESWFVDFEPFKDGEFEDSELGLIPKGWKVGSFGDIAYISTEAVNPQNYPETVFEHFSIPLFDEGKFSAFEKGELIKSNKYIIDSSCMLFSKLNPQFKRVFRPFCKTSKAICSTEFMVYKAIKPVYNSYIYSLLCSDNFYQFVLQNVTGTTNSRQRAIPKNTLNFKIVIPDDVALVNYAHIVNGVFDIMQRIPEDNKLLASIRDVLLPKLMSGEIRVPIGN